MLIKAIAYHEMLSLKEPCRCVTRDAFVTDKDLRGQNVNVLLIQLQLREMLTIVNLNEISMHAQGNSARARIHHPCTEVCTQVALLAISLLLRPSVARTSIQYWATCTLL